MKTILVTGAGGFIGRRLIQMLKMHGHQVLGLTSHDGDIAAPLTLQRFESTQIDFVFHLAARTYVPDSWIHPAEFHRVNVTGTVNVLEFCRFRKIPLTHVSAYLYGIPEKLPIKEGDKIEPNNPYAFSKHMAESVCQFYAEHFDVPVTVIRPFNIFGPGQKKQFLIPEILAQIKAGESIRLKDIAPRRDYLYLDDLVEALVLTLNPRSGYSVFNIGYGYSMSVAEIVDTIQSVAGTALPVLEDKVQRHNEIPDVYADITQAKDELGWRPRYTFKDGIKMMITGEHSV